jgi:hypothetical protein
MNILTLTVNHKTLDLSITFFALVLKHVISQLTTGKIQWNVVTMGRRIPRHLTLRNNSDKNYIVLYSTNSIRYAVNSL